MPDIKQQRTIIMDFVKILFLMYFVTLILLLLLAFVLFKMETSEVVCKVWLIAVYIISGLLGGFLIGKRTKNKKFLCGFFMGVVYFAILFIVSIILHRGITGDGMHMFTTFVLCTASATAGGMVS